MTSTGTRKPRRPSTSPAIAVAAGIGAVGGGTWSKKPPHSSKLITRTVLDQFGLVRTAS
jgi:hypothetical protein